MDVQFAALEIDIAPGQAAQFGGTQAGEGCGQQERAPTGMVAQFSDQQSDFVRGRDVNPHLELALASAINSLATVLAAAIGAQAADDILNDQAALLGVSEDAAEGRQDLAHHGRRTAFLHELVLECTHRRHSELGELRCPDERDDVEVDVLAVLSARGLFEAGSAVLPLARGLADENALAIGDV